MASFGEVLGDFKARAASEPENIVPIMEDPMLLNGLVAWKSVAVKYKQGLKDCPYADDSAKWEWLWESVEFDVNSFGLVAGVRTQDVAALLHRLKGLRLIYPDGTINLMARQYLQGMIMAKLKTVAKSAPKAPAPAPTPTT